MVGSLTAEDTDQFIRDGFIRLEAAFPRPLAEECRRLLWTELGSRGRALLMLFLFSDVGPDDAPTRIRVGSHLDVPPALRAAGETGMPFGKIVGQLPHVHDRPLAWATGDAGDVYLCHPFIVHAATWPHRGKAPRFMAQPPLTPVGLLNLDRADGDYSPVEVAVRIGLGLSETR